MSVPSPSSGDLTVAALRAAGWRCARESVTGFFGDASVGYCVRRPDGSLVEPFSSAYLRARDAWDGARRLLRHGDC